MVRLSVLIALLAGLTACGASGAQSHGVAAASTRPSVTVSPHTTAQAKPQCRPENASASAGSPRSPHNGLIAFAAVMRRPRATDIDEPPADIYTVRADGTGLRRLAVNGSNPRWSPDGERLLFARVNSRDFSNQLWVMDADGSHQRCVVPLSYHLSASWSPDGTRIAGPAHKGVFVLDLRTHERRVIPWSTHGWYAPEDVRWSPDGSTLAGVSTGRGPGPDDYTSPYAVFLIDSAGGTSRVDGPRDLLGMDWSWANGRLVYSSGLNTRGGECNGDLFTVDPKGGTPRTLLALPCRRLARLGT